MLENPSILELHLFDKFVGAENPDDPSYKFLTILNMGSISSRKHEMEIWNMGSVCFKRMKWNFGDMGSISIIKHEIEIW